MATPEDTGLQFEFDDYEALLGNVRKGLAGQIGHVALQKPLSEASIAVKNAGATFDLEAAVKLDYSFSSPFDERRREEAADFVEEFLAKHKDSNDRQKSKDIWSLVRSIDGLYKEQGASWAGNRGLEEEFLTAHEEELTDVQERGGIYTFLTPSGRRLAILDGGYNGITVTTGSTAKDPLDILMDDEGPTRIINEQSATNEEEFKAVFGDVASTMQMLVSFLYGKHDKSAPNDVMQIKRKPKLGRHEQLVKDLEDDSSIKGLEIEDPNVSLDSIGGIAEAKREIEGLAFALKNPELYKKWGTKLPKGILLYGPPGTGKTLLAKALASESGARFLSINLTDIVSKWYGDSEKRLEEIFAYAAKQDDNTVIFFDEIDAIAPDRGRHNAHEATNRTLSTLLTKIDGIASSDNVLVVGTTNKRESIDDAMLSRFSREVEVPLPDKEGREQILQVHFSQAAALANHPISGEIDYKELAKHTQGMSGRRLQQLVQITLEEKIRQEGLGEVPELIQTSDVLDVVKALKAKEKIAPDFGFR